ncbi:C-factor-like isoform X2 [Hyla sarda]|nr:C-factor-like isoform X2 [Hyla sarda]XP_056383382.1 C-factor-like isoform X2 [Hyla sarda]XP_056383383.1 C-factor-like isoform X2 [Hyla sarda]XP_056383384.1 C-factor-like isoform X2 [Hyla sarda]
MAPERILITGCNRGIGYELVRQLTEQQCPPKQIFATCRDPSSPQNKKLNDLAAKYPNVIVIKLETRDANSVKEAVKEVEKHLNGAGLNLLVNNAGILPASNLESADSADLMNVYSTNVVGPFLMAKELLPFLKKAAEENQEKPLSCSKSAIINISSLLGSITLTPVKFDEYPALSYRCSKAALNMLTQCQSLGYKKDGILCTAVHPGWVQTDLGGPNAPLTVEQSVQGILKVLDSLSEEHAGIHISWEGNVLPW